MSGTYSVKGGAYKSHVFDKPDEQSGSKGNALTVCHGEKTKGETQHHKTFWEKG